LNRPICGVNHLHGHLFAAHLERDDIRFPFVGLVVSGGHTNLYHVKGPLDIELIGKTRDDAAGEAFDKVAKLLGLGYPGGVAIEQWAKGIDPASLSFRFPRALAEGNDLDFSFSGMKTAVLRHVQERFELSRNKTKPGSFHPLIEPGATDVTDHAIGSIAAAFQDAVTEVLAIKAFRAARRWGVNQLLVCGGVAANSALRTRVTAMSDELGIEAIFPSLALCTDNAAMIAARADMLLTSGITDNVGFGAKSRW